MKKTKSETFVAKKGPCKKGPQCIFERPPDLQPYNMVEYGRISNFQDVSILREAKCDFGSAGRFAFQLQNFGGRADGNVRGHVPVFLPVPRSQHLIPYHYMRYRHPKMGCARRQRLQVSKKYFLSATKIGAIRILLCTFNRFLSKSGYK